MIFSRSGLVGVRTGIAFFFAEKDKIVSNYFSGISFVTVFVIPVTGSYFAFNIHLFAFFQVFFSQFSQASPGNNIVPFGYFLPVSILVLIEFCSSERKARNRNTS